VKPKKKAEARIAGQRRRRDIRRADCAGTLTGSDRLSYTEWLQDRKRRGIVFWIAVGNGLKPEKAAALPAAFRTSKLPHSKRGHVYQTLNEAFCGSAGGHIREKKYGVELAIVLERRRRSRWGRPARRCVFELAKQLKKAPRMMRRRLRMELEG